MCPILAELHLMISIYQMACMYIYVKDHDCSDHVERLYYSCGYHPICIYCGEYLRDADEDNNQYSQCEDCGNPPIEKRQ